MKKMLIDRFGEIYGSTNTPTVFFAPGRVNMIGEHTDYNGGYVFPAALDIGTYAACVKRNDRKIRLFSINFEKLGIIEASLDDLEYNKAYGWTNYPRGIIWTLISRGYKIDTGMDILIYGNIPNGSGLSSSASIEVLTGYIIKTLYNIDISNIDLALIGQYSENNYNGVNCGIMDQFSIAMGQKDHAIFLNTATLEYRYAPLILDGVKILISSSNKKRGLGSSKYNERRSQCEKAYEELSHKLDIKALCELSNEAFDANKYLITDPINRKRAKHAVYENNRTIEAVSALENNELIRFGQLMNDSHVSLRDDYEVTGIELDTLVESAWSIGGVIGSRMTGAGFGGCTVSIIKEEAIEEYIKTVGREYKDKIGYDADFYVVGIGSGPCVL